MGEPLGYHTNHTPGDGTLLDDLEKEFGSHFENMSEGDKFYLINSLAISLCGEAGHISNRAIAVGVQLMPMPTSTKQDLIRFLIDQV
ncbi:hypothetical protein I8748_22905 [Nostoc sp. CENA67]|uniref:Uncharacterized protein n=1 Tax=Amazonocrinis nigriterrae CENA67 TaxID=2794033 RepID=A0A8J7HT09_9NOST|nr:hypothetical protein [Amazonocrinis nigriterrae]MBH8564997.1 hypothetical protein [Amazonocrinis nigriterrae CENA67]